MKSLTHTLAVAVCAMVVAGCSSKAPTAPKLETPTPITVKTSTAERRPVPHFLEVTGELKGGRSSAVAADAAGKVRETHVERGSIVKAGDVLVKLDDRAAVLNVREADATLEQARVRLELARAEWQRNQRLANSKLVAAAETQKLEADMRGREADFAVAEARRDSARKALDDTEVRAPFAGTVAERIVNAGEYVQPGARVAVMIATEDLRLWLNVPETAAGSIHQGQAVSFRVPAFSETDFAGKVRYISPIVRETGRDLLVEAEVDSAGGKLMQGMFAQVRVMLEDRPGLVVPASAVRKDGGVNKVLVPEGDHLSERIVEIGMVTDSWMEIRSGLVEGESVVLAPTQEARDGTPFTVARR